MALSVLRNRNPQNLVADGHDEDAHERTDEVEEAVRQVSQRRHVQHGGLGHTAGIPGDEYGGNRRGVFGGTAQHAAVVSVLAVHILEHVAGKDDGHVLVGYHEVQEYARNGGGSDHAETLLHETFEHVGEALQHLACLHHASEAHGTDNQPDGVHHAAHPTGHHQVVQGLVARINVGAAVVGHEKTFEQVEQAVVARVGNEVKEVGLYRDGTDDAAGGQEKVGMDICMP